VTNGDFVQIFTACDLLFKIRLRRLLGCRLRVRRQSIILYCSTNVMGAPLLPAPESPPHPGGCWATLLNINLKHCLQHWKKQASPRIASIRRSLKRPKTYPIRTIAACRRPGPYVGYAIAKYRRHSSTKSIVLVSSTIIKLGGRNNSTRSAFRHPDRQNTQHFEQDGGGVQSSVA